MEEARWGAVFPGNEASIPMIQITFPPFRAKSVHPSVNLPSSELQNTLGKGHVLHPARPIEKARASPAVFLRATGDEKVALRAP